MSVENGNTMNFRSVEFLFQNWLFEVIEVEWIVVIVSTDSLTSLDHHGQFGIVMVVVLVTSIVVMVIVCTSGDSNMHIGEIDFLFVNLIVIIMLLVMVVVVVMVGLLNLLGSTESRKTVHVLFLLTYFFILIKVIDLFY